MILQSDCSFLAFLEEPLKSIMSYEPRQVLSAGPGQSTRIPPLQKVTPIHLDLTGVLTARLIALTGPLHCMECSIAWAFSSPWPYCAAGSKEGSGEGHTVSGGSHRCSKGG